VPRDWTNLAEDGRRLNKVIHFCDAVIFDKRNKGLSKDLKLAYIDRLIKATESKSKLVEIVFGIKTSIKRAKEQGLWVENPPPKVID